MFFITRVFSVTDFSKLHLLVFFKIKNLLFYHRFVLERIKAGSQASRYNHQATDGVLTVRLHEMLKNFDGSGEFPYG